MGSDKVDGMILVERKIEPEQNNVIPRQNAFAASSKPPIDSTGFFFWVRRVRTSLSGSEDGVTNYFF